MTARALVYLHQSEIGIFLVVHIIGSYETGSAGLQAGLIRKFRRLESWGIMRALSVTLLQKKWVRIKRKAFGPELQAPLRNDVF